MGLKVYHGDPADIVIQFLDKNKKPANPLDRYDKTYADVSVIRINLKRDLAKDQDGKYLQQNLLISVNNQGLLAFDPQGVRLDVDSHTFRLEMSYPGAYDNIPNPAESDPVESVDYYLTVNFKVFGYSDFIEAQFDSDEARKITITADTNRN